MKIWHLAFLLIFGVNLFAFDVFDPVSRNIPKKHFFNVGVKKIYFYIHFISARYGKKFDNHEIQKEFESQKWYKVNNNYNDSLLNEIDKNNVKRLTAIYDSLAAHINQLKTLKNEIVWKKPTKFIINDTNENCIFTINKVSEGFHIKYQFQNTNGIFFKEEYDISLDDFGNTWNGYSFDGAYEAIAINYEFINIEFYPDEKTKSSIIYWYKENRGLNNKQAVDKFNNIEKRILKFKGETFFTGYKNDTVFPHEYIYLPEEKSFVLVYSS